MCERCFTRLHYFETLSLEKSLLAKLEVFNILTKGVSFTVTY